MFSNLKKEEKWKKISSGRVHVWGSSLRDPWGSFAARPLTDSLELYRGDQTTGGTAGSQTAIFVLCGLFVTEGAQDPAVFCLPKGNVSQGTAESSKHPFWVRRCFCFPHFLQKNFKWPTPTRTGLSGPESNAASCLLTHSHSLQRSNDSLPSCRRGRTGKTNKQNKNKQSNKSSACVYLLLKASKILASAEAFPDVCSDCFQDVLLFFWRGNALHFHWVQEQFLKSLLRWTAASPMPPHPELSLDLPSGTSYLC